MDELVEAWTLLSYYFLLEKLIRLFETERNTVEVHL